MQIIGTQKVTSPFLGHGSLVINGQASDNLRNRTLNDIMVILNSMTTGVQATINDDKYLVLEADGDFTISGHQDVLDVFGIVPPEAPAP